MALFLAAIIMAFILPVGCAKKEVVKKEAAQPAEMAKEEAKEKAFEQEPAEEKKAGAREENEEAVAVASAASHFQDIHFAYDRFDLRPEEREILDIHAQWLKAHLEYVVRIEGNCDERGTVEYNIALGQRRADSAAKYLENLGVEKSRMSTVSYGKERPVDPAHTEEAWEKNRRDHFVVTLKNEKAPAKVSEAEKE